MNKTTVHSVSADLQTHKAVSEERWLEILGRVKRLEMVLIGTAGTTISR